MRKTGLLLFFILVVCRLSAQESASDSVFQPRRVWAVAGSGVALYGGSWILLDQYWYKKYPASSFHFFNDVSEWCQVDKTGHALTAYTMGRFATQVWRWSGMSRRKSVWIGGLSGLGYQTVIEMLDGFSYKWGFSVSDMVANVAGSSLLIAQELAWDEQRIQLKYSVHVNDYTIDPVVKRQTRDLFGDASLERLLKDYNAQTYWLSVNLHSFWPESGLPGWLNVAVGYGAENMYAGRDNTWKTSEGAIIDYRKIPRVRQFYLSPDIDFTKIHTRKKGIRVLLQVLNMIKIPAPALEINSKGNMKLHALYF